MDRDKLIEALERAEGSSIELDCKIFEIAFPNAVYINERRRHGWFTADGQERLSRLSYTASIDAALTLVPDGWEWEIQYNMMYSDGMGYQVEMGESISVDKQGAPLALLICIAALKAKDTE